MIKVKCRDDRKELLLGAGMLHGHFCPGLAKGVLAGTYGMQWFCQAHDLCGENVMGTRVMADKGKHYCYEWGKVSYYELNGEGMGNLTFSTKGKVQSSKGALGYADQ